MKHIAIGGRVAIVVCLIQLNPGRSLCIRPQGRYATARYQSIDINVTRTIEPDAINVYGCFQFRRGVGVPRQRPGDPAIESLARTPCVSRTQQGDLFTAGTEFS